ncbi:MAG: response regulator [Bacteriovorax sp.]
MNRDKIKILIVDDEAELLEMYREIFELDGFDVFTADSASVGLETYKNNKEIKLIISDSNMRDMSGIQFLKSLKEAYETIPLFYLTTGSLDQSEENVKNLGGHGLVLKPFDVDEILLKIRHDLKL